MNDFITGLGFLTRIKLKSQEIWEDDAFSRSLPWFPLVGAVIGLFLAGINWLSMPFFTDYIRVALLLGGELYITGGLLCDGLMDTADGVFSGRSRERMLEIMKDSAVGANGMIFFVVLMIFKTALYLSLPAKTLTCILFVMPVVTRLIIVGAVTLFPYARAEGTGQLFVRYARKAYLYKALLLTALLTALPLAPETSFAALATLASSWYGARYLVKILGGLTGDTYGFLAETGNVTYLFCAYFYLVFIR